MGSVLQSPPGLWPQGSATALSPPRPFYVSPRVLLSCKNTVIGFRAHSVWNNLILACYICKDLFPPSGAPSKALTVDLGDTLQPTLGEALVTVAACSFTCPRPPGIALLLPPTSPHLPGVA